MIEIFVRFLAKNAKVTRRGAKLYVKAYAFLYGFVFPAKGAKVPWDALRDIFEPYRDHRSDRTMAEAK